MFISRSFPGSKRWSFRFRLAGEGVGHRDKGARHGAASYRISITSPFRVLSANWREYRWETSSRFRGRKFNFGHVRARGGRPGYRSGERGEKIRKTKEGNESTTLIKQKGGVRERERVIADSSFPLAPLISVP